MSKLMLFPILLGACVAEAPAAPPAAAPPDWDPAAGSGLAVDPHDQQTWRVLPAHYEVQTTPYWCGPTATDIALSARVAPPGQAALASQLGTTENGTDWVGQVTGVLNQDLGHTWYTTRELPDDPPTQAQRDLLWHDVTRAIDDGFPVVANIVAPPDNHPPGYPNTTIYHYFAVIGYDPSTTQVYIADPADFQGNQEYWLTADQLATLIPPKGYTALADCASDAVGGAIGDHYAAIGGCTSVVGPPITEERGTPDDVGRYNVFESGSIYWTPQLGAHEVHGAIRDAWAAAGWEAGRLGYPTSDEYAAGDGRRNDFEHGYIQWSASTGQTTIGTN
jgi:hypothetical protein|nr:C39 family peptidase [Kofleriaceae bacterium]